MLMTVEEVGTFLRDAVGNSTERELEPALEAIGELAHIDRIISLIAHVLKHPYEPTRCAPLSFSHTLGFEKFVLVNGQPDFMLRMHIWRPADGRPPGHIHNHRCAVTSAVVRGGLEKQIFVRDPGGISLVEYREERENDGWRLDRVGMSGLRQTHAAKLTPGARYALTADALHRIRADDDRLTATLFLETAISRATTAVFTTADERVPERLPKEPLTVPAYRQGLTAALVALRE